MEQFLNYHFKYYGYDYKIAESETDKTWLYAVKVQREYLIDILQKKKAAYLKNFRYERNSGDGGSNDDQYKPKDAVVGDDGIINYKQWNICVEYLKQAEGKWDDALELILNNNIAKGALVGKYRALKDLAGDMEAIYDSKKVNDESDCKKNTSNKFKYHNWRQNGWINGDFTIYYDENGKRIFFTLDHQNKMTEYVNLVNLLLVAGVPCKQSIVGLYGPTGSFKSAIVKCIKRAWPTFEFVNDSAGSNWSVLSFLFHF